MIETKILSYLQTELNTTDVYLETPKGKDTCVVFQIVDRSSENLIDAVTVRIYSYGPSKVLAAQLDENVRRAMYDITDLTDISSVKLGGGGDTFDTSLKLYRYQSYFNLTYMEE